MYEGASFDAVWDGVVDVFGRLEALADYTIQQSPVAHN